jgi:lipopolysaccharide export system permease protein
MRYAILIAQGVSNDGTVIQVKQVPSITLWHIMQATNKVTPSNTIAAPQLTIAQASAEMMWRLSLPLMTLTLMLLAIPLGYVNPRQGRSLHLLTALMIYLVYSNLVSIIQAWIAQDKMVWWVGLCAIHSAILGLIGGWLWYRVRGAR